MLAAFSAFPITFSKFYFFPKIHEKLRLCGKGLNVKVILLYPLVSLVSKILSKLQYKSLTFYKMTKFWTRS